MRIIKYPDSRFWAWKVDGRGKNALLCIKSSGEELKVAEMELSREEDGHVRGEKELA